MFGSRPPARTRGLKPHFCKPVCPPRLSRPPAWTRGLKPLFLRVPTVPPAACSRGDAWIETITKTNLLLGNRVASSREDAWIETTSVSTWGLPPKVASSREDAWIETGIPHYIVNDYGVASSREDAWIETFFSSFNRQIRRSRPPARTRGLKRHETTHSRSNCSRVLPRGRVD